ncbi:hypothetical protein ISCGN_009381 [Ixodes scapularis]
MILGQLLGASPTTFLLCVIVYVRESESQIWESVNTVVNKHYRLHVISNCPQLSVRALKNIREPLVMWNADGLGALLRDLSDLEGYKSDVLVPCWKPDLDHLIILVENRDFPYKHIRWIFAMDDRTSERSMSALFVRVDCRAVVVTSAAAYVPLDTYSNCSKGVRRMSRGSDPAFDDRPIANLTALRVIEKIKTIYTQEWNYVRLEPQTTITESIVRKSGVKAGLNTSSHYSKFGRSNAHHRFGGALGAIQDKKADLATFEIFLTESIWYGVDLAGMVRYDAVSFFSPLPKVITDVGIIGRPFSKPLWTAIWASLSVYLGLLFAFSMAEQRGRVTRPHQPWRQLADTLFYLTSVLILHVPQLRCSRQSSTRILLGFWFMFAITISAIFTGTLTSLTNFPPKTRAIKTLDQLVKALEKKEMDVCIKDNRYFRRILGYHLLDKSKFLRGLVMETIPIDNGCTSVLCCLERVTSGTHVFIANKQDTKLMMGRSFAGTSPAKEDFFLVHVVIVSPKLSPYTKAFYNITERLTETGVLTQCRKLGKYRNLDWRLSWQAAHDEHQHFWQPLRLKDIVGLLFVLGLGLLSGTLAMLGELAVSRTLRGLRCRPRRRRARTVRQISIAVKEPPCADMLNHLLFEKPK